MANAAIVIDNLADAGTVAASSQVLTMPKSNLLTPHPSERWRSLNGADWFVLDKGSASPADTIMLCGLTCSPTATLRLRLSTIDATGEVADVLDTGAIGNGSVHFDITYGSFVYQLEAPAAWRYTRIDIEDPDAAFVEAGCILDGLSETFKTNFSPSGSIQHVDLSGVAKTSSGMTLTWDDNTFRRLDLPFDWVSSAQRYGVIERLDRVKGRKRNVLLLTDSESDNLPRDSIYGLVTDLTPIGFGQLLDMDGKPLFSKQLRIDERI